MDQINQDVVEANTSNTMEFVSDPIPTEFKREHPLVQTEEDVGAEGLAETSETLH